MHTASRMQDMVRTRKENTYSVTKNFFLFFTSRVLGVESSRGGAMKVAGGAASKLAKIKIVRKSIARILTVYSRPREGGSRITTLNIP